MDKIKPGELFQHHQGKMRGRPIAHRAKQHLAFFGLGPRNGFTRIGRIVAARQAGHDIGHIRHHANANESLARVKAWIGV